MFVAFMTFGCRLNRAEALDQEARYLAAGHTIVPIPTHEGSVPISSGSVPLPEGSVPISPVNFTGSVPISQGSVPISTGTVPPSQGPVPEVIVVRGCSVTAKAQHDCEKAINRLKERFPLAKIVITGCLPDAVNADPDSNLHTPAINLSTSRAYLKIQDGCSGKCAFCIVPQFRGPPRSVPFAQVIEQARAFLAAGFRELVVTGCNLALYHDSGHDLPDLLSALARLPSSGTAPSQTGTVPVDRRTDPVQMGTVPAGTGTDPTSKGIVPTHRVRLGSLEPGINSDKLLDIFEKNENICRFIHLSVQSGSDRILKLMNRPYSIAKVRDFCVEARQRLGPRLALGADFITGFPGETDEDFTRTCELVKGSESYPPFVNLHVFPYSERPGTPAATMPDSVPRAVRIARAHELEALGRENRRRFAASFLGQTVQVCVEKDGNGWTGEYLHAKLPPGFTRRQLVEARVSSVEGDTLILS